MYDLCEDLLEVKSEYILIYTLILQKNIEYYIFLH